MSNGDITGVGEFFDSDGNCLGPSYTGIVTGNQYCVLELDAVKYHYDVKEGKATAKRRFVVQQSDLDDFVHDMMGDYDWDAATTGGQATTILPAEFPGKSWLIVATIDADAFGDRELTCSWDDDTGLPIAPNGYEVSVGYEIKDFLTTADNSAIPEGTTVKIRMDFRGQCTHPADHRIRLEPWAEPANAGPSVDGVGREL